MSVTHTIRFIALALAMLCPWPHSAAAQAQTAQVQTAQLQTAQAPLACGPSNLGQTVCQAEGRCVCSYSQGGLMTRTPPGYAWDCSLLLGACSGGPYPTLSRAVAPYAEAGGTLTAAGVREAQTALKQLGFDPGGADGVVGPRTRAATRAFQQANGLNASGNLSPETLERLRMSAPRR